MLKGCLSRFDSRSDRVSRPSRQSNRPAESARANNATPRFFGGGLSFDVAVAARFPERAAVSERVLEPLQGGHGDVWGAGTAGFSPG